MRHFPAPLTRAESDAFVDRIEESFEARGVGLWALELRASGEFLGFTGLWPVPAYAPGAGGSEVGWRLARQAWGHGYATEGARAVVDAAFGPLGIAELWSLTATTNHRSQAVMLRLGMTFHSLYDHPKLPPGHPIRPQVAYHLPRPDPSE
jgi:RimJ/RimL family protein N-acetyltransferase